MGASFSDCGKGTLTRCSRFWNRRALRVVRAIAVKAARRIAVVAEDPEAFGITVSLEPVPYRISHLLTVGATTALYMVKSKKFSVGFAAA